MSRVYWDTMLFVYWMEQRPAYAGRMNQIVKKLGERQDVLCTSVFTIGEVLTGLAKRQDHATFKNALDYFDSNEVEVIPFGRSAALKYSKIRSVLPVTAADAIHLACASEAKVDVLITNDNKMIGRTVPGIQFIVGLDTNLY